MPWARGHASMCGRRQDVCGCRNFRWAGDSGPTTRGERSKQAGMRVAGSVQSVAQDGVPRPREVAPQLMVPPCPQQGQTISSLHGPRQAPA